MWRPNSISTFLRKPALADLARVTGKTSIAFILLWLTATLSPRERAMAQTRATASAKRPESLRSFPLTKFYDTPDPLPPGKSGELIRSTEFEEYDLPPGVSAVRLLYYSRSASGDDVAASGVILFPDEKPPAGGWPVIAWAHGLSGVARQCAPSLARNLQQGPFFSMYVGLGYAVVATDYTGLGTRFRNAFADTPSNAMDVIYSIPAARRVVSQLGSRWIAMGNGEGGMAAVGVAELEREIQDPNYLGSIAISRLADLQDVYEPVSSLSYNLPLSLAYGIKTVYPQFEVNDMLTDKALSLYQQIGQVCSETEAAQKPSAKEMLKRNWESNNFVQKYFSRSRLGLQPANAPLLVISSEADPSIAETTKIVARLCKQGDRVQFEKYPEDDPGRVIGDSVRDQMAWIHARFANGPVHSNCSVQH
jgi:acetyl esterase/lipase